MSVMMSLSWCRVRPRSTQSSWGRLALRGDSARLHLTDFWDSIVDSCTIVLFSRDRPIVQGITQLHAGRWDAMPASTQGLLGQHCRVLHDICQVSSGCKSW